MCAVSYTHLDVYKRQYLSKTFFRVAGFTPKQLDSDTCGAGKIESRLAKLKK